MPCAFAPRVLEGSISLYWEARCPHGRFVSGSWAPRTREELLELEELERVRFEAIAAGTWPEVLEGERSLSALANLGPWWDRGNEIQGGYLLAQLLRVWEASHQ